MINKRQYKIYNDKKVLHKVGKQWVTVSALSLALLGAGSVATTVHANADTTANTNKPTVTSTAPANIQSGASNLHDKIMNNTDASSKVDSGSNVANYAPASVNSKFAHSSASAKSSSVSSQSASSVNSNSNSNVQNKPLLKVANNNNQGFINPTNRDNDANNNPDAHYNFESSDKMYDTPTNDYLNNVNHLTHDKDGEAIRPQMEVTYAWNGHAQDKNISAPKINSNIIKTLNDRQIGVLPLYNPGISMRGDDSFPSDNELMQLQNYTDPQASLGYQPEKIVPYRLVGYLFTAPRNTEFTDLFTKYFYPQSDNGYALDNNNSYFSYSLNKTTVAGSHTMPNDLHFTWENNTSADYSEHDGTYINLEYKPQMNKITFIDKVTGQPVGYWISSKAGSGNAINYDLYSFYVNVSSPKTYSKSNIVIPKGYALANSDMVKFHNTIYPPTGYVPGRFNFGHNYVIPLVKPTNDTITYTYKGKPISVWTSKTTGTTDKENSELLNIYNIITSTNAPSLPKGYWIPNSPKPSDGSLAYNNYPLEKFLNTLYPAVGDTKGFHYGKHYVVPVDLIPSKQSTIKINVVPVNNHNHILNSTVVNGLINKPFNINDYGKLIPKGWTAGNPISSELLGKNTNKFTDNSQTVTILVTQSRPNGLKPSHHSYESNITVHFVLNTNHKKVLGAKSFTNQSGTPFDINKLDNDVPNGYVAEFINHQIQTLDNKQVNQFATYDQSVDIPVAITRPDGFVPNPIINVSYVDMGNRQTVKSSTNKGMINHSFNTNDYTKQIPKGYHFVKVLTGNNITKYNYQPQSLVIGIKRDTSSISINYVNRLTGQLVAKGATQTGIVGSDFDLTNALNEMPNGYVYGGMHNSTDVFGKQNTTIDILVDKDSNKEVPLPKSSSASAPSSKAKSNGSSKASKASSKASSASSKPSSKASSASSKSVAPSASVKPSSASKPSSSKASSASSKKPSSASSTKSKASSASAKPSSKTKSSSSSASKPSSKSNRPSSKASQKSSSAVQPSSAKSGKSSKASSASSKSIAPSSKGSLRPSSAKSTNSSKASNANSSQPTSESVQPNPLPSSQSVMPSSSSQMPQSSKATSGRPSSAQPLPAQSETNHQPSSITTSYKASQSSKATTPMNKNHKLFSQSGSTTYVSPRPFLNSLESSSKSSSANSDIANHKSVNSPKVAESTNHNNDLKLPQTNEESNHSKELAVLAVIGSALLMTVGYTLKKHYEK